MSLHVMIDLQCPNNAGGIATLNSHGKSLTQEQCWLWFVANFCKPVSNLRDKFHGMLTQNAGWLDGDWNEVNARTNVLVLGEISSVLLPLLLNQPSCCWLAHMTVRMCWGRWRPRQDNGPSSTESELLHLFFFHYDHRANVVLELHNHQRR